MGSGMDPNTNTLSNIFETHIKVLGAVIDDIKENEVTCVGDWTTADFFWIKICLAVQVVSKDATNLCMAFSQPPPPAVQECQPLLQHLESVTVALVSAFYALPVELGVTLKKRVHQQVLDIVTAVQQLAITMKDHNFQSGKDQLQKTGSVWECCDQFPNIPRDNPSAVLAELKQYQSLVNDALDEITDAQNEAETGMDDGWDEILQESETNDDPSWTEDEKALIVPAVGLVKVAKSCLKKSITVVKNQAGSGEDHQVAAALDALNKRLMLISPAVDDVVSCLYPPMEQLVVKQKASDLLSTEKALLEYVSSSCLTGESDKTWLEFLLKAADHNWKNITHLVPGD